MKCASYGNELLNESYTRAKGLEQKFKREMETQQQTLNGQVPEEVWTAIQKGFRGVFSTYTDYSNDLSAAIRDAVGREVVGMWRRLGKDVLSGRQTLGRFSAGRALVIRDRGVRLERGEHGLEMVLRLKPGTEPVTRLAIYVPPKDLYVKKTLERLEKEPGRINKGTVVFDRRNARKFSVFLAYEKEVSDVRAEGENAQVYVLSDGTMRVHCAGRTLSLSEYVYRATSMREHIARIHGRLRAHLGKLKQVKDRRRLSRKLSHTISFEVWSEDWLHQLSRRVALFAVNNGAKDITWHIDQGVPELPWHQLQTMTSYKAGEYGITQIRAARAPKKALQKKTGSMRTKLKELLREVGV